MAVVEPGLFRSTPCDYLWRYMFPLGEQPLQFNFVLSWDGDLPHSFISQEALQIAGDKRLMAAAFRAANVTIPQSFILETPEAVMNVLELESDTRWVLKWPTGCGAAGHRLLKSVEEIPTDWPRPFLLQEFVEMEKPEVYLVYAGAGELSGWNVRRLPPGAKPSPWVAHAQGARYQNAGQIPAEALVEARKALVAASLFDSFGCADLVCDKHGVWKVLEINTDGLWNHVDRDISLPGIADEIDARLNIAFAKWIERTN